MQKTQYKDVLDKKDKSAKASAWFPQIARVIWWNDPGLYQQYAHRLLKKITEHADNFIRTENGETVIYRNANPNSNFKSLFTLMVSNLQNLNQVNIEEFLRVLQSHDVKKDNIHGEPRKIKYSNVAPYCIHQRLSTQIKYEDKEEDDNNEDVRPISNKHRNN